MMERQITIIMTRCVSKLEPSSPPPPQHDILIPPILLVSLRSDYVFIREMRWELKRKWMLAEKDLSFEFLNWYFVFFLMVFIGLELFNFVFLITMICRYFQIVLNYFGVFFENVNLIDIFSLQCIINCRRHACCYLTNVFSPTKITWCLCFHKRWVKVLWICIFGYWENIYSDSIYIM